MADNSERNIWDIFTGVKNDETKAEGQKIKTEVAAETTGSENCEKTASEKLNPKNLEDPPCTQVEQPAKPEKTPQKEPGKKCLRKSRPGTRKATRPRSKTTNSDQHHVKKGLEQPPPSNQLTETQASMDPTKNAKSWTMPDLTQLKNKLKFPSATTSASSVPANQKHSPITKGLPASIKEEAARARHSPSPAHSRSPVPFFSGKQVVPSSHSKVSEEKPLDLSKKKDTGSASSKNEDAPLDLSMRRDSPRFFDGRQAPAFSTLSNGKDIPFSPIKQTASSRGTSRDQSKNLFDSISTVSSAPARRVSPVRPHIGGVPVVSSATARGTDSQTATQNSPRSRNIFPSAVFKQKFDVCGSIPELQMNGSMGAARPVGGKIRLPLKVSSASCISPRNAAIPRPTIKVVKGAPSSAVGHPEGSLVSRLVVVAPKTVLNVPRRNSSSPKAMQTSEHQIIHLSTEAAVVSKPVPMAQVRPNNTVEQNLTPVLIAESANAVFQPPRHTVPQQYVFNQTGMTATRPPNSGSALRLNGNISSGISLISENQSVSGNRNSTSHSPKGPKILPPIENFDDSADLETFIRETDLNHDGKQTQKNPQAVDTEILIGNRLESQTSLATDQSEITIVNPVQVSTKVSDVKPAEIKDGHNLSERILSLSAKVIGEIGEPSTQSAKDTEEITAQSGQNPSIVTDHPRVDNLNVSLTTKKDAEEKPPVICVNNSSSITKLFHNTKPVIPASNNNENGNKVQGNTEVKQAKEDEPLKQKSLDSTISSLAQVLGTQVSSIDREDKPTIPRAQHGAEVITILDSPQRGTNKESESPSKTPKKSPKREVSMPADSVFYSPNSGSTDKTEEPSGPVKRRKKKKVPTATLR